MADDATLRKKKQLLIPDTQINTMESDLTIKNSTKKHYVLLCVYVVFCKRLASRGSQWQQIVKTIAALWLGRLEARLGASAQFVYRGSFIQEKKMKQILKQYLQTKKTELPTYSNAVQSWVLPLLSHGKFTKWFLSLSLKGSPKKRCGISRDVQPILCVETL